MKSFLASMLLLLTLKSQDFLQQNFLLLLMVLIWSRNRNRNHNLSKVGTGTVINSYGSATLPVFITEFEAKTTLCSRSRMTVSSSSFMTVGLSDDLTKETVTSAHGTMFVTASRRSGRNRFDSDPFRRAFRRLSARLSVGKDLTPVCRMAKSICLK